MFYFFALYVKDKKRLPYAKDYYPSRNQRHNHSRKTFKPKNVNHFHHTKNITRNYQASSKGQHLDAAFDGIFGNDGNRYPISHVK